MQRDKRLRGLVLWIVGIAALVSLVLLLEARCVLLASGEPTVSFSVDPHGASSAILDIGAVLLLDNVRRVAMEHFQTQLAATRVSLVLLGRTVSLQVGPLGVSCAILGLGVMLVLENVRPAVMGHSPMLLVDRVRAQCVIKGLSVTLQA